MTASASTRHDESQLRLRALAFWVGHHQATEPAPRIGPSPEQDRAARDAMRSRRIGELVLMVPELKRLACDPRAPVRATAARCFAILATAGRAPADREVWRLLLGLAKYDDDADVRSAADTALVALERHGAVAAPCRG
ncbi:hypothetical protein ACNI3K_04605 [Demequina sp. SO4-13]|uniref:hypothetical protein n=1 Tax=Demequina sp. SO4-13 TaxID=3401027 RepID=UPI003AF43169